MYIKKKITNIKFRRKIDTQTRNKHHDIQTRLLKQNFTLNLTHKHGKEIKDSIFYQKFNLFNF